METPALRPIDRDRDRPVPHLPTIKQMAAFVRARDGQLSRLPISYASHLELDHIEEFDHGDPPSGGPTRPATWPAPGPANTT